MTIPQLYSKLAESPLYIIVLAFCMGYLILTRKDRGFFVSCGRVYSVFIIINYLIAIYIRFFN
jgi:hypothetical protein